MKAVGLAVATVGVKSPLRSFWWPTVGKMAPVSLLFDPAVFARRVGGRDSWRKISITLIWPWAGHLSEMAWFQQLPPQALFS